MIGQLQRDEADVAGHIIRSDSLPFEPVRVGPPLIPADVAIMSIVSKSDDTDIDVLNLFDEVDRLTYSLTALLATLVIIWFVGLRFSY